MLTSCYKDDIKNLQDRLDAIEGTQIASLQGQITAIKATLPALEKADKELNGYISSLQKTAAGLQESISSTNSKIEEVEAALKSEVSESKTTILSQLAKLKADMESELSVINATIAALQLKDQELDKKIADLKVYVDTELANNKDWANATFATLEQYSAVAGEIETIKASITTLNSSVEALENRVKENIAVEVSKALEPIKDDMVASVISEVVDSYMAAINSTKNEITAAYTTAIASAISSLENLMKSWVSDQLKGYYTIAETEGKLAALHNTISENDKALQADIDELAESLASAKEETTAAYKKAIEDAINDNNGVVDGKIAIAIAEVNVRIENEIKVINAKIASIESRLDKVEGDIATIGEQITNINNTIANLQDAKSELEGYIENLQNTAANLQKSINATNSKIDEVEAALKDEVSEAKVDVLAQLAALKADMEAELAVINSTISALQLKDEELDQKIADLKQYVDTELANNKDWANATFATLEQYASISSELAAIKAQMTAITQNISALESRINNKIENDIAAAVSALNSSVQDKVNAVTAAYSSAISDAKEEITAAYTAEIQNAFAALEHKMKNWVNEQLQEYYTIQEVDGMLAVLRNEVASGDSALLAEIEALEEALAKSKEELINVYSEIVKRAINENNGVIDEKIAGAIAQATARIDSDIQAILVDIESIKGRLNKVEGDIANINGQIANINSTIQELQNAHNELESYVGYLQSVASNLQESVSAINGQIDEIESAMQGELSTAKAEILAQLSSLKTDVEEELAQINATISALQAKDIELNNKISTLQSYVDTELANNKNWANATFATLEQQSALAGEVATIKAQIATINQSITDLENRINAKVSKDIADAVATLNSTLQEKISAVTSAYTAAISKAKNDITAAYTAEIQNAFSALESSLKKWVNEQLAGYYTTSEVEGLLAALRVLVNEGDAALLAEIEALEKELAKVQKELSDSYKEFINKAIYENNGVIDQKIADAIAHANHKADNEVKELGDRINAIESRLSKVEGGIADLMKRIQSVTYIPKYSDGKATMTKNVDIKNGTADNGIAEFDFQISPKDAVADIATNWQSILSMKAVYTQTRAISFVELPILTFEADENNGIISIAVSGENLSKYFYYEEQPANVSLYISDGNNTLNTPFIELIPNVPAYCEIRYTGSSKLSLDNTNTKYNVNQISYTSENDEYVIRFDGQLHSISGYIFGSTTYGSMTSITLPPTIRAWTSRWPWSDENNLKSVYLEDLENWYNLSALDFGNPLESGASLYVKGELISELVIPSDIKVVPPAVFKGCSSINTVRLHKDITEIKSGAFQNCTSITNVYCEAITPPKYRTDAFRYHSVYYESTKIINCRIYVPAESVAAYKAADGWKDHAANILPYDGAEWGEDTQYTIWYTASTSVTPSSTSVFGGSYVANEFDQETGKGKWIFSGKVTKIGNGAFSSRSGLTSVIIPSSVTSIGNNAFEKCSDLTSITIPDSVTEIGQNAFTNCTKLADVKLGIGLTSIKTGAFSYCYSLTSITLPENISSIGASIFYGCQDLKSIYCKATIPPGIYYQYYMIGSFPYNDGMKIYVPHNALDAYMQYSVAGWLDGGIDPVNWSQYKLSYIVGYNFETNEIVQGKNQIFYTTSDNKIASVGNLSSYVTSNIYSDGLGIITCHENFTSINSKAFSGCNTLTSITIPDSVTSIDREAFDGCTNLTDVNIPDSVTTIGLYAFYDCKSLATITIGKNVSLIKESAFYNCTGLKSIYCNCTTPPVIEDFVIFYDYNSIIIKTIGCPIYVPRASYDSYKSAWSVYKEYLKPYDFTE